MRLLGHYKRRAFTLIELLVVIAIIGILVAIAVVGIIPLMNRGPDAQDMTDILNLQTSVNSFKAKYGCFPPSKIRLRASAWEYIPKGTGNGTGPGPIDALDVESFNYLNQIWPRLTTGPQFASVPSGAYAWNGVSAPPKGRGVILEGDQCLVFFLGGPGGTLGFSPDPQNPCGLPAAGQIQSRITFHTFQPARLQDRTGDGFPSYLNNWGTTARPFAYFSSGKTKNGYNSGWAPIPNPFSLGQNFAASPSLSHEITGLGGVAPYYETLNGPTAPYWIKSYLNPSSFQIISAGQDGVFTDPTLIYPLNPPTTAPNQNLRCHWSWTDIQKVGEWSPGRPIDASTFWQDNRANFSPNQLQSPVIN